ncbi:proline-rich protein [Hygrophoropsis aurantiaca]|uniref:Proline-rich protein n=1 Tax=Hygrophoropsis aurantiaca TaxID=72124 RepID=A0ACB8AHJ2_9AGAM|nr:proline-rich protein [Hygrophoropsis aurantiaca]
MTIMAVEETDPPPEPQINHAFETTALETNTKDTDTSDAQTQIIASLRSQVTDLFSQVTQLNGKLVSSYDRVSNLEDQLHESESSLRNASISISSLELERTHHLAALNTGLLVEKAHVTAELTRLMERATEEAAQRGQAESAKKDIEKDLDDLSATLFDQANTMVAEARLGQARSERKVREAEDALKGAEDAVKGMQTQMQALQEEKERAEREAGEAKVSMGKGKWVDRGREDVIRRNELRLMTTHVPYTEFIAFVTHLRGLRPSQPQPPAISGLLAQPFLARLLTEDSEPTVRLDLAPSLNWLSRRSVLGAIHTGMLIVEPIAFSSLLQELYPHAPANASSSVCCALCGTAIVQNQTLTAVEKPPSHPLASLARSRNSSGPASAGSWFKNPLSTTNLNASPNTALPSSALPEQVYIFRLSALPSSSASAQPPPAVITSPSHSPSTSKSGIRPPAHPTTTRNQPTQTPPYPLCTSNYCLLRLRSTCSLWAFVRTGVVERIWEEEVPANGKLVTGKTDDTLVNGDSGLPTPTPTPATPPNGPATSSTISEKPAIPPRRRRLWEMASALGERAASWGKENSDGAKEKDGKKLPAAPPSHPSAPHDHVEAAQVPPPLPRRSEGRSRPENPPVVVPEPETSVNAEPQPPPELSLPPSDSGKDTSQESFVTPVDEVIFSLPSPTTTQDPSQPPISPSAVPLPASPLPPPSRTGSPAISSRPGSPISPRMVNHPSHSRPGSPAIRSRAGSPLPHGSKLTISHSRAGSPIPRSGSPVAPPLPRRAAARRAAPVPPGTTAAAPGSGSAPTTVSTTTALSTEAASVAVESVTQDQMQPANSTLGESAETPEEQPNGIEEHVTSPKTLTNGKGKGKAADIPVKTSASPAVERLSTESSVPSDSSAAPTSVDSIQPARPSVDTNPRASTSVSSNRSTSSEREADGFASDATWEERTWKEVVRLKEEMFWARVGGVR